MVFDLLQLVLGAAPGAQALEQCLRELHRGGKARRAGHVGTCKDDEVPGRVGLVQILEQVRTEHRGKIHHNGRSRC
jgi:hypothetical protein